MRWFSGFMGLSLGYLTQTPLHGFPQQCNAELCNTQHQFSLFYFPVVSYLLPNNLSKYIYLHDAGMKLDGLCLNHLLGVCCLQLTVSQIFSFEPKHEDSEHTSTHGSSNLIHTSSLIVWLFSVTVLGECVVVNCESLISEHPTAACR